MSETFLTPEEVRELTGYRQKKPQAAMLQEMGLRFWVNALGWPVVPRSAIDGLPANTKELESTKPTWKSKHDNGTHSHQIQ